MQTYFQIHAHLKDKQQQVLEHLRVEVWGKQGDFDDLIDIATTDENGVFVTQFSSEYDAERPYGRYDRLFFTRIEVDLAGGSIVEARSMGLHPQTFGDGTSQLQRKLPALDPQYVAIEERSIENLLDIIRNYAESLPYYDADDRSNSVRWTEFLPDANDLTAREIATFIEDPKSFRAKYPQHASFLAQPHRVLFFSFLQLLQYAKRELNTITKRHLDFFYQEALRMVKKDAAPDEVHVLFELKRDVEQHLIPAGTLLQAGKDSQGQERLYKSNEELVVNKAQIAQLKTVFNNCHKLNNSDKLYAAPDATQVTVETITDQDNRPPWKTFGGNINQSTRLGFALASPLLHLTEGKRTILLTLALQPSGSSTLAWTTAREKLLTSPEGPFQFLLSSAQGWIVPDSVTARLEEEDKAIQYILTILPENVPIEPLQEQQDVKDPNSPFPILKIELKNDPLDKAPQDYGELKQLLLQKACLEVEVEGVQNFYLSNDSSVLDSKKPFEPFGFTPQVGSSFQVSHPEIAAKKLDALDLTIQWMGVPSNLKTHYENYFKILQDKTEPEHEPIQDNTSFKWHNKFFDRGREIDLKTKADNSFFDDKDATKLKTISLAEVLQTLSGPREDGYQYERVPELAQQTDIDRYFEFALTPPDFQHSVYATLFAKQANSDNPSIKALTISPPYTPTIKRLSINYSSSVEIDLANYGSKQRDWDQLFHLHPFGYTQWPLSAADSSEEGRTWLPEYTDEGALYIGLQDLKPEQHVSILFQMADGTANPDVKVTSPIQWSYLSNNQWILFQANDRISDTTTNPAERNSTSLARTGIIVFYMPPNASTQHTILPQDLHWIRATVKENSDGISQMIALHTQAIRATFQDNQNAPDHYSSALPPESITRLDDPIPAVNKVSQPYAAFGGRPPEQEDAFYTRTSERLRHKNRAISRWDYERIVLEQFPEVYKVKCLTADDQLPPGIGELPQSLAPGEVRVVVIPDVKNRGAFNPLEPKLPQTTLQEIRAHLQKYASSSVSIEVRNPIYEQVKTRCTVKFTQGYDINHHKELLQQALKEYLAPWAYDQSADISLGNKLYGNALIYFLENKNYIDFVARLKLSHSVDGKNFVYTEANEDQENVVHASRPDAILVTAADHQVEDLSTLPHEDYTDQKLQGIGYVIIGVDAQVGVDVQEEAAPIEIINKR